MDGRRAEREVGWRMEVSLDFSSQRLRNHLRFRMHMKLIIDMFDMKSHGFYGDFHAVGDHFVTQAVDEPDNNFVFPIRKG